MQNRLRLGLKVKLLDESAYGYEYMVGIVGTIVQLESNAFLISTVTEEFYYGSTRAAEEGEAWVRITDNYKVYEFQDYYEQLSKATV